jgi:opacity protein-like surface antigen
MNMRTLLLALTAAAALFSTAQAADNLPANPVVKAFTSSGGCLAAGNCSGWYGSFGLGAQSNSGTPDILANGVDSAFSDGLDIFAGVGYQLWKGQWFAGIEVTGGYEFTSGGIKPAGGNFVGTEFVKLGYNFFPSSATAAPSASQNPFLNLVSANFLANSTPAIIAGGVQRHGLSVAALGVEIDTVVAAGWSSYAQLYNSPSQQGLPDDTTFRIGLQKHF